MRWPSAAARQSLIVAHPLWMGYLWGGLTIILMALFEVTFEHRAIDARSSAVHLLSFAVLSPAWGYLTRWGILRRQRHAR